MIFLQKVNKKGIFIGSGQEASIGVSAEVNIFWSQLILENNFSHSGHWVEAGCKSNVPWKKKLFAEKGNKDVALWGGGSFPLSDFFLSSQMKFFTDYKKSSCVFENNVEILLKDFQWVT